MLLIIRGILKIKGFVIRTERIYSDTVVLEAAVGPGSTGEGRPQETILSDSCAKYLESQDRLPHFVLFSHQNSH